MLLNFEYILAASEADYGICFGWILEWGNTFGNGRYLELSSTFFERELVMNNARRKE